MSKYCLERGEEGLLQGSSMFVTNASPFSDPPHWSRKVGLVKQPCRLTRLGLRWVVLSYPS